MILTVVGLWHNRVLGFLGTWFFAILAPSSSVVPVVTETMAEHRMYLALAAVITVIVFGLYALLGRRSVAICLALAVVLGVLTVRRNQDYHSELAIWSDTVARVPGQSRGLTIIREMHYLHITGPSPRGDLCVWEAAVFTDRSQFSGSHTTTWAVSWQIFRVDGRRRSAIFETVFRIAPGDVKARNNFGIVLYKVGRISKRSSNLRKPFESSPTMRRRTIISGWPWLRPIERPKQFPEFEKAVRIDPDYAEAHYNLGTFLRKEDKFPRRSSNLRRRCGSKPDYAEAHRRSRDCLYQAGQIPEAIAQCEEVLRIKPDSADTRAFLEKLQKIEQRGTE